MPCQIHYLKYYLKINSDDQANVFNATLKVFFYNEDNQQTLWQ
jgi:hypothetical protein